MKHLIFVLFIGLIVLTFSCDNVEKKDDNFNLKYRIKVTGYASANMYSKIYIHYRVEDIMRVIYTSIYPNWEFSWKSKSEDNLYFSISGLPQYMSANLEIWQDGELLISKSCNYSDGSESISFRIIYGIE